MTTAKTRMKSVPYDPEAIARRLYEELWNRGNFAVVHELIAEHVVDHTPLPTQGAGLEGFKQLVSTVSAAFPDLHITVDDVIGSGEKVSVRWTARGTNMGPLLGLPPSGEHITIEGIDIFRMEHGRVVEHWGWLDVIGLMQQLGIAPQLQLSVL
jgi:steroid delta-isomerase-like uncharacterized protein